MIEKDILTSVRRSEEKGKEILKDTEREVALLRKGMLKDETEFVKQLEEKFTEKKKEEKERVEEVIQKENERIKLEYNKKIEEVQNNASSKSKHIVKEILKELIKE